MPVTSLSDRVRHHAATRPDALAASCNGRRLTFGELHDRSSRAATFLQGLGVARGARVAHLDVNGVEAIELMMGCSKLGATYAPLNWRLAGRELASLLRDADCEALVCGPGFEDAGRTVVDATGGSTKLVTYTADPSAAPWAGSPADDPANVAEPDDIALLHYTSGTTGDPKGVMLSEANQRALLVEAPRQRKVHPDARVLLANPMFHVGAMAWVIAALDQGAHMVMLPRNAPEPILDALEAERVTTGLLVPTVLAAVCNLPDAKERDLSLETLGYGASPITSTALLRALDTFDCPMFQVYGLTESCGAFTYLPPEDHDPGGPREYLLRSAGKAFESVDMKIVDEAGADVPVNTHGEVCVRGDLVMAGYFRRPEETAAAIDADGWLHTGDGGSVDEDGYLFLRDRVKDMIVSGAENVFPGEVEEVLARHPAVAEVAVIGVPHEHWVEQVAAVVVPRPGTEIDPEELQSFARNDLAGYKVPRRVEVLGELPKTTSGKIMKRELRDRFSDD